MFKHWLILNKHTHAQSTFLNAVTEKKKKIPSKKTEPTLH